MCHSYRLCRLCVPCVKCATVIVHAGEAIWLNPFDTVLFSVCSAATVLSYVPMLHGMFAVM